MKETTFEAMERFPAREADRLFREAEALVDDILDAMPDGQVKCGTDKVANTPTSQLDSPRGIARPSPDRRD